jgi:hypothetical protein
MDPCRNRSKIASVSLCSKCMKKGAATFSRMTLDRTTKKCHSTFLGQSLITALLCVIVLNVVLLNHSEECQSDECLSFECYSTECHSDECHHDMLHVILISE